MTRLRAVFGHASRDTLSVPIIDGMTVRKGRINVYMAALYIEQAPDAPEVVQKVVFSLN